jgi:sulfatase maturation enzyme AslB (radical SAM superfamily)
MKNFSNFISQYESNNSNLKIFIFGAGTIGRLSDLALKNEGIGADCFIDSDIRKQGNKIQNKVIISPDELKKFNTQNTHIFIACNYFSSIVPFLKKNGFKHYYIVSDLLKKFDTYKLYNEIDMDLLFAKLLPLKLERNLAFYNEMCNKEDYVTNDKLVLKSLDVQITEKCSLKCKDCSNLMQYYKKPIDTDFNILVNAMDKIMSSVDFIDELRVLGGDPFMYKELGKIINKLSTYENVGRIVVYTNAKFIPKNQNLDYLRLPRVILDITNYGEASSAADKFVDFAKKEGISYSMNHCNTWQDCGRIVPKSNKTEKELEHQFNNCCNSDLISLLHGKLYRCPFSANGVNLKAFEANKDDEIDLNDNISKKELRDRIMHLAFGKKYLTACRFCNGRDYSTANIPSAIQAKAKLDYKFQS